MSLNLPVIQLQYKLKSQEIEDNILGGRWVKNDREYRNTLTSPTPFIQYGKASRPNHSPKVQARPQLKESTAIEHYSDAKGKKIKQKSSKTTMIYISILTNSLAPPETKHKNSPELLPRQTAHSDPPTRYRTYFTYHLKPPIISPRT